MPGPGGTTCHASRTTRRPPARTTCHAGPLHLLDPVAHSDEPPDTGPTETVGRLRPTITACLIEPVATKNC